jgi:hypothetical protein
LGLGGPVLLVGPALATFFFFANVTCSSEEVLLLACFRPMLSPVKIRNVEIETIEFAISCL